PEKFGGPLLALAQEPGGLSAARNAELPAGIPQPLVHGVNRQVERRRCRLRVVTGEEQLQHLRFTAAQHPETFLHTSPPSAASAPGTMHNCTSSTLRALTR